MYYRLHTAKGISVILQEQDKSSDIEQQQQGQNVTDRRSTKAALQYPLRNAFCVGNEYCHVDQP